MAVKKSAVRQTFYEVVFQGKPKVVRAFLMGFVMGNAQSNGAMIWNFPVYSFSKPKSFKFRAAPGLA